MNEEWRPVVDFPGYEVSSMGRVRRIVGGQGAVAGKVLTWHLCTKTGYPNVRMQRNGKAHGPTVHKVVCRAFYGPLPDGMLTRHLDGNKLNNNLSNLVYGTPQQNMLDRNTHGTMPHGENHHKAKLLAVDVGAIRTRYAAGTSAAALAAEKGVSRSTIHRIAAGKSWKNASNRRTESVTT